MSRSRLQICARLFLIFPLSLTISACNRSKPESDKAGLQEAVSTATDAYIYGYPLVTMDITRKQMTNVAIADQGHAPIGQLVKMRSYPDASYRTVTAPNADTLYTTAWMDVSREPWILSVPEMGRRYYLLPMLSGWTDVFQAPAPEQQVANRRSMRSRDLGGQANFRKE